jgi:hypothetical protein
MKKLILVLLLIPFTSGNIFVTQEIVFIVSQPIFTENGITESKSTYVFFLNYNINKKMSLTCAENSVITERGSRNRNITNILGLKIGFSRKWDDMYINFGDTVKVDLLIPDLQLDTLDEPYSSLDMEEVIKATIICLFKNAASYDFIKYLDLNVIGCDEFEKYSNVYSKENIFKF